MCMSGSYLRLALAKKKTFYSVHKFGSSVRHNARNFYKYFYTFPLLDIDNIAGCCVSRKKAGEDNSA